MLVKLLHNERASCLWLGLVKLIVDRAVHWFRQTNCLELSRSTRNRSSPICCLRNSMLQHPKEHALLGHIGWILANWGLLPLNVEPTLGMHINIIWCLPIMANPLHFLPTLFDLSHELLFGYQILLLICGMNSLFLDLSPIGSGDWSMVLDWVGCDTRLLVCALEIHEVWMGTVVHLFWFQTFIWFIIEIVECLGLFGRISPKLV